MRTTANHCFVSRLGLGLVTVASLAWGEASKPQTDPAPATVVQPPAEPEVTAVHPGMRIYLDPETGTLGMPAILPDADKPAPPSEPLVEVVLPDGSVMLDLKGTCQEYYVMRLDAQGNKSIRCVQDPKLATQRPAPALQPQDR